MEFAIFLIEGGPALELVRQHIADLTVVRDQNRELATELGVRHIWTHRDTGAIVAVDFERNARHPDFTVPRKSRSHPKKGTSWEQRFAAVKGYRCPDKAIGETFNIPRVLGYGNEGSCGSRIIGYPLSVFDFLYVGENGPFAMSVPDIEAEVRAEEARGMVVSEPAKSFRMEFDGCRRLSEAEWDGLFARHASYEQPEQKAA